MDWNVYHYLNAFAAQLNRIEQKLNMLVKQEAVQMASMEDLQAKIDEAITEVTANTDAVSAASTVMSTLSQQLKDALAAGAADPTEAIAAVQQVIDGIDANTGALAAAVAANTPAAP